MVNGLEERVVPSRRFHPQILYKCIFTITLGLGEHAHMERVERGAIYVSYESRNFITSVMLDISMIMRNIHNKISKPYNEIHINTYSQDT